MPRLPRTGTRNDADPHIIIIGAGGSRAAGPRGDKYGRYLSMMGDLVVTVGLEPLLEKAGIATTGGDFEALYNDLATSGKHEELVAEIESTIRNYFAQIRLPDINTVYDYLLLSLRPKDLIATFNWDPLLAQALHRHQGLVSTPQVAFLHGNVAMGFCGEHSQCGWHEDSCRVCGKSFSPSPLLFPVEDKDYTSLPFIRSQWALLEHELEEAYFFTIFGYSAPVTDVAARNTLLRVWSKNEAREIAEIDLIDVRSKEELDHIWADFIVGNHYSKSNNILRAYSSCHPRRSCDALFAATMRNEPWEDDWLPEFENPVELREWIDPLWKEEIRLRGIDQQFSGRPCREWHEQGMK